MKASKGGVRALSLLPVLTVMLLCCTVDAGNPCFAECYGRCSGGCGWNPICHATCAGGCGIRDSCDYGVHQNNERKQIDVNQYCKLGCVSSVCSVITTVLNLNSPADNVYEKAVKGSMERCNNACSAVCTKHFNA